MEESEKIKFERFVAEAYEKLPEWIQRKMDNVAITVEDRVDGETAHDMGLESDMDLLGLYRGVPQTERTVVAGFELPDTITLYRLPILEEAGLSRKSIEAVVFETLWHEIAHHFGLSEDDVERREAEEFRNKEEGKR